MQGYKAKTEFSRLFSWVADGAPSGVPVAAASVAAFLSASSADHDIDPNTALEDVQASTIEELLAANVDTIATSSVPVFVPLPKDVLEDAAQMRALNPRQAALIHGNIDDRQGVFKRGFFSGTGELKQSDNGGGCTIEAIEMPGYSLQKPGTLFSTSAHCFGDDTSYKGRYKVSIEYSSGALWEREISADEHVWLHPLYQEKNFDYDIALVYIPHRAPSAFHRLPVDMTYGVEVYADEPIGSAMSAGFPFDMKGKFVAQEGIVIQRDPSGLSFQSDYDTVGGSSGGALVPEDDDTARIVAVTTGGRGIKDDLLYSLHTSFKGVAPYLNDIPFLQADDGAAHPFFTHRISGDSVRARLGATTDGESVGVWEDGTCVHVFGEVAADDGYQWAEISYAGVGADRDDKHTGQMSVFTAADYLEPLEDSAVCGPENSRV